MQAGLLGRGAPGGHGLDRRPSSSSPPSTGSARRADAADAAARARSRRPPPPPRRHHVCRAAPTPPPDPAPPSGRRAALAGCCCAGCLALLLGIPAKGRAGASPATAGARGGAYDQYFAAAMGGMEVYEAEVAPLKERLFRQLAIELVSSRGKSGNSGGGNTAPLSVLELGVGRGPNFRLLSAALAEAGADMADVRVTGVDPNPAMLPYARESAASAGFSPAGVDLRPLYAEQLSAAFGDGAFDAAIVTLVLCSVPDAQRALAELRRVVKTKGGGGDGDGGGNGGRLLLIEHVVDPNQGSLRRLGQTVLNPLQRALADGCNLTRDTEAELRRAGFFEDDDGGENASRLERLDISGLGLLAPHIAGVLEL